MRTSQAGVKAIAAHEGFSAVAYPDPGSRDGTPWTIGYGHTRGVKEGDRITKTQGLVFLQNDLASAESAVSSALKVTTTQNQFDAFVSFAFNVGNDGFRRSSALRYHNKGRFDLVPSKLALWNKNDGEVMRGLVNRRAAEGLLYSSDTQVKSARNVVVESSTGKSMLQSKTAAIAGGQGLGGIAILASNAADIKDNVTRMAEGLPFNGLYVVIAAMAVSTGLAACWFVYDRYQKAHGDGA